MSSHCRRLALLPFLTLLAWPALAQNGNYALPPGHYVHGHPWSSVIPDPDKYDWSTRGARPGYQYRGMEPMQQRFYDYIKAKQARNEPLSTAENATIRWLISSRRWPEAPRPNKFWADYMRYMRSLTTQDLNVAQNIMLTELTSRGLVPVDVPPNRNFERVRNYLNSGPFQSRNWFERVFGRVEPWMDNLYSGWGYDMRAGNAPAGNKFPPGDPFNGMSVSYNISGATLSDPTDVYDFTTGRSFKGILGTGTLSVSGTLSVGGYGADVNVSCWAGDKKDAKTFYVENKEGGGTGSFSVSVPIPAKARTGGFAIRLDGRYSMGGGHRGLYVTGDLGPSQAQVAADQAAADAAWRKQVEETLARLGYENTPEGKEVEAMRQALAGGAEAWKAYVDKRLKELGYEDSPDIREYHELNKAAKAGGQAWEEWVAAHSGKPGEGGGTGGQTAGGGGTTGDAGGGGGTAPPTGNAYQPPPDEGGLQVGTGVVEGQVNNPSANFIAPTQVSCATNFTNIPAGSTAVAAWARDGQALTTSQRPIAGNGWVSFSLLSGGTTPLQPGVYTVTITVGGKVLGRKSFTVRPGAIG